MKGVIASWRPVWKMMVWLGWMAVLSMLGITAWGIWGNPASTESLKVLQTVQTLVVFVLPALLAVYLWSPTPARWLHVHKGMNGQTALLAVLVILFAVPAINMLSLWNQQMTLPAFLRPLEAMMQAQEEAAKQLTERFLQADNIGQMLLNVGLMALLPAVGEELCFRGVVQGLMLERNARWTHVAIWVTAALFSFIHFQFYGFVPRMLLGALFGYALVWTGSLWVPILMHFTNNGLAVIAWYVADHYPELDKDWMDQLGSGETLWVGLLSLVMVGALIFMMKRAQKAMS